MARKRIESISEPTSDIHSVAEEYIKYNTMSNEYGKIADKHKATLKAYIPKHEGKPIETEDGTVKLSYRDSITFNEGEIIEAFRNDSIMKAVIRTKEYIDFDKLENMLYNKEVPKYAEEILTKNKSNNPIAVLSVVKSSKKSNKK